MKLTISDYIITLSLLCFYVALSHKYLPYFITLQTKYISDKSYDVLLYCLFVSHTMYIERNDKTTVLAIIRNDNT